MEMPTYRVYSYYWSALRKHGVWTVKKAPPPDEQIGRLLEFAKLASVDISEEE